MTFQLLNLTVFSRYWNGSWWNILLWCPNAVSFIPCIWEFITSHVLRPRITKLLQLKEAAFSNSFAKLSARLAWHTTRRGVQGTHKEGQLRWAIIPRRVAIRRGMKKRVNVRGCLLLCLMVEGVRNQRHIVVQTAAHGNGQRLTSPCKKEKNSIGKERVRKLQFEEKMSLKERRQSCNQLSASLTSLFLIGVLHFLLQQGKTKPVQFSVFLTTFPEMVTFALFS